MNQNLCKQLNLLKKSTEEKDFQIQQLQDKLSESQQVDLGRAEDNDTSLGNTLPFMNIFGSGKTSFKNTAAASPNNLSSDMTQKLNQINN